MAYHVHISQKKCKKHRWIRHNQQYRLRNQMEGKMKDKKKNTALPAKVSLIIRLFAAVYLLYLVVSLRDVGSRYEGMELVFYVAAMAVFGIVGITIGILSAKDLLQGRYIDGKLDNSTTEKVPKDGK